MKRKTIYILSGAAILAAFIFVVTRNWKGITAWLIPKFEGFSSSPYWDVSHYTWGYGTRAPGSTGTITRDQAMREMNEYLKNDYDYLSTLITVPLNANKWAALLSFSYNLGRGNAANLVPYINSNDADGLRDHWLKYVYAGGLVSSNLQARRKKELEVWFS